MVDFTSILENLNTWGYWVVFLGAIFEGEVILVSTSAACALGYLDIHKVFTISFVTTVVVDQAMFFIGRRIGSDWLIDRFPKLEKARAKAFQFLHSMDIMFIFCFRFIYGIRTISPLIIGSAKIKPFRFIVGNFFSGALWAGLGCWIGYFLSNLISSGNFSIKTIFILLTFGLILLMLLVYFLLNKRLQKK